MKNRCTMGGANTYNTAGRLAQQVTVSGGATRVTSYSFDAGGTTRFETTRPSAGSSTVLEERASYTRGDDRIVAVDRRVSGRRTLEAFRYDPLGRRVWVSTETTCAPTNDISCVTRAVRRTVWDGDERLAELSAPRDSTQPALEELDTGVPLQPTNPLPIGDPNPFYGRVVYGPGLAVDQPLSVTRLGYQDLPVGGTSLSWPAFTVMVFWDYRGAPTAGLVTTGAFQQPFTLAGGQTTGPPLGSAAASRCALVQWPFGQSAYDQARGRGRCRAGMGACCSRRATPRGSSSGGTACMIRRPGASRRKIPSGWRAASTSTAMPTAIPSTSRIRLGCVRTLTTYYAKPLSRALRCWAEPWGSSVVEVSACSNSLGPADLLPPRR